MLAVVTSRLLALYTFLWWFTVPGNVSSLHRPFTLPVLNRVFSLDLMLVAEVKCDRRYCKDTLLRLEGSASGNFQRTCIWPETTAARFGEQTAAAVFTIVLNVTFFYSFVIGGNKGVGRLCEGWYFGGEGASNFFFLFLNVYSNVNIFFNFIVKPKCGRLF